jgi:hypothetical protein
MLPGLFRQKVAVFRSFWPFVEFWCKKQLQMRPYNEHLTGLTINYITRKVFTEIAKMVHFLMFVKIQSIDYQVITLNTAWQAAAARTLSVSSSIVLNQ